MPRVDLFRDVPGYAEAVRREDELRAAPFLGLDERIAGLPAVPLTARRVQMLYVAGSPFLLKLKPEEILEKPGISADVLLFLWVVSPEFKPSARARDRWIRRHRKLAARPALPLVREILEYMEETYLDAGGDGQPESRSYYSTAAALTVFFHRHFHLEIDTWENGFWRNLVRKLSGHPNPLDIPLKIAFQLVRVYQKEKAPDAILHNRLSQPCIDAWLRDLNRPKPAETTN